MCGTHTHTQPLCATCPSLPPPLIARFPSASVARPEPVSNLFWHINFEKLFIFEARIKMSKITHTHTHIENKVKAKYTHSHTHTHALVVWEGTSNHYLYGPALPTYMSYIFICICLDYTPSLPPPLHCACYLVSVMLNYLLFCCFPPPAPSPSHPFPPATASGKKAYGTK